MTLDLGPNPSVRELQLGWESQFWYKSKINWTWAAKFYEDFKLFFGEDRKPRDIFRGEVVDWKIWLEKKGRSNTRIVRYMEMGARLYRFLGELEVVEAGFNPFTEMQRRRIEVVVPNKPN